jgi:putative ABC transport system ATP-binding protein
MARPIVTLENVTKTYRMGEMKVPVLKGISLTVSAGEFVAVMGQSGSGKSTLMNILGCLDTPTSGRYFLDGRDVTGLDSRELAATRNRMLGFVFQQFNLLPRIAALENVELPLLYAGVPSRQRRVRAREALARVGLADRMDHRPHQLSGGQQQRVAIARALIGRPRVLFADEPTGNLDTENSLAVIAMLQELERDGLTIVLVTHEPEIAAHAARTITLRDGLVSSDRRRRERAGGAEGFDEGRPS